MKVNSVVPQIRFIASAEDSQEIPTIHDVTASLTQPHTPVEEHVRPAYAATKTKQGLARAQEWDGVAARKRRVSILARFPTQTTIYLNDDVTRPLTSARDAHFSTSEKALKLAEDRVSSQHNVVTSSSSISSDARKDAAAGDLGKPSNEFEKLPEEFYRIPKSQNELASLSARLASQLCVRRSSDGRGSLVLGLCRERRNTTTARTKSEQTTTESSPETRSKLMTTQWLVTAAASRGSQDVISPTSHSNDGVMTSIHERDDVTPADSSIGVVTGSMGGDKTRLFLAGSRTNAGTSATSTRNHRTNTEHKQLETFALTLVTSHNATNDDVVKKGVINLYSPLCVDDVRGAVVLQRELVEAVIRVETAQRPESQCWQDAALREVTAQLFKDDVSLAPDKRDVIESTRFTEQRQSNENVIASQRKWTVTSAARVVSSEVRAMVCQFVQELRACLDDVGIAKERKHDVIEDAMASFRERSAKSDATLDWPIGAWFY